MRIFGNRDKKKQQGVAESNFHSGFPREENYTCDCGQKIHVVRIDEDSLRMRVKCPKCEKFLT